MDVAVTVKNWSSEPDVKTSPIKCFICDDPASVVIYAPHGCTCSPNKIQPRCEHHLMRAYDTGETYTILEDFRLWINPRAEEE